MGVTADKREDILLEGAPIISHDTLRHDALTPYASNFHPHVMARLSHDPDLHVSLLHFFTSVIL